MKPVPDLFQYTLYYGDQPNILNNAPDGWMKTTVEYSRSDNYGGVLRALTLPYTFVKDSAKLLRQIYYNQGQPRTRFTIDKRNNNWGYDNIFQGRIDFSTKHDQRDGFEVSAIEDSITAKLDAYEDVKYALPLTGDDVIDITLTPIIVKEKADFIFRPSSDQRSNAFFVLDLVNNQQLATKSSVQNVGFLAFDADPDFSTSNYWFYIARASGNLNISGHIDGAVYAGFGGDDVFEINFYKSTGEVVKTIYHQEVSGLPIPFSVDFDFAVQMNEGERLFVYFQNLTSGNNNVGFQINQGNMSMTYNTQSPSSTCKGILAKDIYKRLIAKLDSSVVAASDLLTNEFGRLAYTCSNSMLVTQVGNIYNAGDDLQMGGTYYVYGADVTYVNQLGISTLYHIGEFFKAIPGYDTFSSPGGGFVKLEIQQQQILISFKDFFQDIFALKCGQAAFGVDAGVARLEDLSYFYRAALQTSDFGRDIKWETSDPNTKRWYTSIKVGYKDQQYNALNGSQEVMSQQTYSTPRDNTKNELNAIAISRADPFGIEEIRAITPNIDPNSAASRSDNDTWLLMLHPTENRPYTVAEGTQSYTGVDGSYYNWQITPKQNLLRGSRFHASCLDRVNGNIIFESGEKNTALITIDLNGRRVAENENVAIGSLGKKIFRPELFIFTVGNVNGADLLSRPYGEIRFNFDGIPLKGFIQSVSVDEAERTSQKFTVECCGDVDLGGLANRG